MAETPPAHWSTAEEEPRPEGGTPGYVPPKRRRGASLAEMERVLKQDKDNLPPVLSGIDPNDWTRLRARAGLPKAMKWEKVKACYEFGHLMKQKIVARIHHTDIWTQIDQCDAAIKLCRKVQDDEKESTEARMNAVRMQAALGDMRIKMVEQSVKMAKKGQEKVESNKPKNLPPMLGVNVQVNSGNGQPTSVSLQPVKTGSALADGGEAGEFE